MFRTEAVELNETFYAQYSYCVNLTVFEVIIQKGAEAPDLLR
jgi:hypothetical protein